MIMPSPTTQKPKGRETPPALPEPSAEEVSLRAPTLDETAQIKAEPPKPRFVEVEDASELKVGEVADLLRDYQRLARVMENLRIIGEEEGRHS